MRQEFEFREGIQARETNPAVYLSVTPLEHSVCIFHGAHITAYLHFIESPLARD